MRLPQTRVLIGDALEMLRTLPAESVQCCVTSPPYFGLRSYLPHDHPDKAREIGAEDTLDAYMARVVAVMREVRRVLRPDGVLWLNIGDSYAAGGSGGQSAKSTLRGNGHGGGKRLSPHLQAMNGAQFVRKPPAGLKPKDLLMIPARVGLALQADGWWVRSEVVWAKRNPMPESVRDRPTCAHEKLFLLAKSDRYFFDAEAVREPNVGIERPNFDRSRGMLPKSSGRGTSGGDAVDRCGNALDGKRNARNVQSWLPTPYKGSHYAVMPLGMADWCIRCGSRPGDTVLDPFGGSGTTAAAAAALGRDAVLIDLDPRNEALIRERLAAPAKKAARKRVEAPPPAAAPAPEAAEPPLLAAITARVAA